MADFKRNLSVAFDFEKQVKDFVRENGYLKTIWGNKRRFPNYALPEIQIRTIDGSPLPTYIKNDIESSFRGTWQFVERRALKETLQQKYNVKIEDNKDLIREDETKILNSYIQGSGAGMLKKALILIYNNKRLNELGVKPVLLIHDEIILESPREHAEEAAEIFSGLMLEAAYAKTALVPFKSGTEIMDKWLTED